MGLLADPFLLDIADFSNGKFAIFYYDILSAYLSCKKEIFCLTI